MKAIDGISTVTSKAVTACCQGSLCATLWKHRSREILPAFLYDGLMDVMAGQDAGMRKLLAKSRRNGCLDIALYSRLMKMPPARAEDVCAAFLRLRYFDPDGKEPPAPWTDMVLLHCIGRALNLPEDTCPSEEDLNEVISGGENAPSLMERMSPFIPFVHFFAGMERRYAEAAGGIFEQMQILSLSGVRDVLWQHRGGTVIAALLDSELAEKVAGTVDGMTERLAQSRESGVPDEELLGCLRRGMPPLFSVLACQMFLARQYHVPDGEIVAPWVSLTILRCIGLALNLPAQAYPSERDLAGALADDGREARCMERLSPVIPFAFALGRLDPFAQSVDDYADDCGTQCCSLARRRINGLRDVEAVDGCLQNLLALRGEFLKTAKTMRDRLASLAEEEDLPRTSACLGAATDMAFAFRLREGLEDVRAEILDALTARIPAGVDTDYVRALLDHVRPPLPPRDRSQAEEELALLDEGALSPERSPLLAVVLPALRGEREIDGEWIGREFPDFPYSGGLVLKLRKHALVLAEDAGTPAPESGTRPAPEPAPVPGRTPEPESAVSPMPAAKSESRPASGPVSRPAPKTGPKPARRPTPKPGLKSVPRPEPRPAPAPVAAPAPASAARPMPAAGPEPEPQPEAGPDLKPEPKPAPGRTPEPESAVRPMPAAKSESRPASGPVSRPAPKPGPKPAHRPAPKPGPKSVPRPRPAAGPEPEPQSDAGPDLKPESKPESAPAAAPAPEAIAGPTPAAEPEPAQQSDAGPDLKPEPKPEPVPVPAAAPEQEPEPEARPEAGPEPLPGPEPEAGPASAPGARPRPVPAPATLEEGIREIIAGATLPHPAQDDEAGADDILRQLVVKRDGCGLYWLACTLGPDSTIPTWLARLLHLGTAYRSGDDDLGAEISLLCGVASERMEDLEEKQKLLLAAAILRPALMMPDPSMLTVASALSSGLGEGYGLREFMNLLCASLRSGSVLDDAPSTDGGSRAAEKRKSELRKETERLLTHAEKGKTAFHRATALKKRLFGRSGEIGGLLHACMDGNMDGVPAAAERWEDERNVRSILAEDNIEAAARDNILKDVRAAMALVRRWIALGSAAGGGGRTFAEVTLERLHATAEEKRGQLETSPEGQWFLQAMDDLHGHRAADGLSPAAELRLWPLRLPVSRPDGDAVFEVGALVHALRVRDFDREDAVAASLAVHAALGRISLTGEFLEAFPAFRGMEPSSRTLAECAPMLARALPFTIDDAVAAARKLWREAFETQMESLRVYLGDCYFRGAIVYDQQSRINGQMSDIEARCGGDADRAPGIREMQGLAAALRAWDEGSLEEVNGRIAELEKKAASFPDALRFLAELKREVASGKVYSAAWDNLARLEPCLLRPSGDLPALSVRSTSTLATARRFYDTPEAAWADQADADSARLWSRVCALGGGRFSESRFLGVTTELQRWLGFVLSSDTHSEAVFTDGRPNHWVVRRYSMTINSPVPQWGSGARGRHTIAFGWNVTPTNIANLVTSGRIGEGEALTVVCCGPLTCEQRREMLRLSRNRWPVFPLVVDENLFLFLASQDEATRTEKLFEVALAGSMCNPYTPEVAGAVPREMFFGREDQKRSVFSPTGSCIVYGGRQLGKSALLEQIFQEHGSGRNTDTTVVRHSMTVQDASLLDAAVRKCAAAGVVDRGADREGFRAGVMGWLERNPGRRLLLLLDECDRALDQDARAGFPDVEVFRNLMTESSRGFKVVLTGLHCVQRFSLEPNSPLYHYGDPICIGPLAPDAACDLMTRPMHFLGLEFESPQLVQMALSYCNYQPKLIQMFCRELVDGVGRLASREPVHVIDRSTMLRVYDSQDLKTRIGQCFTMTLALDDRYLVIGYTMALQQQGEQMSIGRLQRDLRDYWPGAFSGSGGDVTTLRSLLHEMEGLGLIISLGGSYRLRTPNIVELLGGQENVLLMLERFHDEPWSSETDPDDVRLAEAGMLVASQYNLLLDGTSRLCWISGSRALGLDQVPGCLAHVAGKAEPSSRGGMRYAALSGTSPKEAMKSLRRAYAGIANGGLIATFASPRCSLLAAFMTEVERWLGQRHPDGKHVKVICLVEPACLHDFIRSGQDERFASYQMPLRPWTQRSVDYWRKERTIPGLDARAVMNATGGWHLLVAPMLESGRRTAGAVPPVPDDFIPDAPGLADIVRELRDYGEPCPEQDIPDIIDMPAGMDADDCRACIATLKSLHVLRETSRGLVPDGVAARTICGENA